MCIKNWKKMLLAAVAFAVIAQIIHTLGAFLTMSYYTNPAYFPLWSKLMMPSPSPPGADFYLIALLFGLAVGFMYALGFSVLQKSIPGKGAARGVTYGLVLFALAVVPNTLSSVLTLAIPFWLLIEWAIESLVIFVATGAVYGKLLAE